MRAEYLEPRLVLATLLTDQPDYSPGQSALITGSGFAAHETVDLKVLNDSNNPATLAGSPTNWTVQADASGAFATNWLCTSDLVGANLEADASGETSGSTAAAYFTDGASTPTAASAIWTPGQLVVNFTIGISSDFPVYEGVFLNDAEPATTGGIPATNNTDKFTGALTSGSPIVTGLPSTTGLVPGEVVVGTGIPSGTKISSVNSSTQITLTANATASGTNALQINDLLLNGALTSGLTTVTGLSSTSGLFVGQSLAGTGIAQHTKIASIDSSSQITLNQPAIATGTESLQFITGLALDGGDMQWVTDNTPIVGQSYSYTYTNPILATKPFDVCVVLYHTTAGVPYSPATLTSGSPIVRGLTTRFDLVTGEAVTGNGIPAGTTITSINKMGITTLNGAITATQTTINVASGASIVNNDLLVIGSEEMRVTAGGGTNTLTVIRGYDGTAPAAASSGASVVTKSQVTLSNNATLSGATTLTFESTATGSHSNIGDGPGFNTDNDYSNNSNTDPSGACASSDLSITKVDNEGGSSITSSTGALTQGQPITYTIVVTNHGPNAAAGQVVSDPVLSTNSGIVASDTWTFASSTGGGAVTTGSPSSGSGDLSTLVNLPAGATITFSITAQISSTPTTTHLSNTATVTVPFGDDTPSDNTATDNDALPKASPTFTTTQTPTTATAGSVIASDLATFSGGISHTGTITFDLQNSSNVEVSGYTLQTDTVTAGTNTYSASAETVSLGAGTYHWHVVYSGDSNNNPYTLDTETLVVGKASPMISTQASGGGPEGSTGVFDTATLSSGYQETGNVVFKLEDAGNNVLFTSTKSANGNSSVTSDSYTPAEDGTYHWVVSYAGDANNNPVTDNGSETSEQVTITEVTPTLTTSASPATAVVGTTVTLSDTATLTGNPSGDTGTVTFTLKAPDGTTVYTSSAYSETGNFTQSTSATVLVTQVGTYTWHASYSDDGNLTNDTGVAETVTVGKSSPTISTQASETAGGVVGSAVLSDSVIVSGGYNPTGTVTFTLDQPDHTTITVGSLTFSGDGTHNLSTTVLATQVGTYTWHASYGGDSFNNGAVDNGANESLNTVPASPTLTTTQSPTSGTVGSAVLNDTAHLAGGYNPTGSILFTLYAPDNSVAYTVTDTVSGDGDYTTANTAVASQVGTYQWVASYTSSNNLNNPADSPKGNEPVTISPTNPAIPTSPSAGGVVDTVTLKDSATLTLFGTLPGTITFTLYAPDNSIADSEVVPVSGSGTYTTPNGALATQVGTYQWVASYSGDDLNSAVTSTKGDEPVATTPASPTLTTSQSPTTGTVGTAVLNDTAHLTGGYNPTGSITFTLYAPDNSVAYTVTDTVSGDGDYTTANTAVASQVGTYQWVASYTSDNNLNNPATSPNGNEPVTTDRASPSITTANNGPVNYGSGTNLNDSATLSSGYSETGSITFYLFAPGVTPNATDSSTLQSESVYYDTVSVNGNGTYSTTTGSHPGGYTPPFYFTPPSVTYEWIAVYTGDTKNNGAQTNFDDEPETVTAPFLTVTKTPDSSSTLNSTDQVGFTIVVTNSGTGTAYMASLLDNLPTPTGVSWTSATLVSESGGERRLAGTQRERAD